MRVDVERRAMMIALDAVAQVVPKRVTIPILANVRLTAMQSGLDVAGTNLERWMTDRVAAVVDQPGTTTIPGAALRDIVKAVPDGSTITIVEADGRVKINAGRSRWSLPCLDADDWPNAPIVDDAVTSFALPSATLMRWMTIGRTAVTTDETRPYLSGPWLMPGQADVMRVIASDGHRLVQITAPTPPGCTLATPTMIPPDACGTLIAMAEASPEGDIDIAISDTLIRATSGSRVLTAKLMAVAPPDFGRVIPPIDRMPALIRVDRRHLTSGLDRVMAGIDLKGRAIKLAHTGQHIVLTAAAPDGTQDGIDEVPATMDGPSAFDVGVNPVYLAAALGTFPTQSVEIRGDQPSHPIRIDAEAADDVVWVIMPMKV